jgi:uncharacterized protein YbbK (DUF523 family)
MDNKAKTPHAVLVSACLLGVGSRYDSTSAEDPALIEILEAKQIVPVCPEQLGGLPTPRAMAEIAGDDGRDDGFAVLEGKARVIEVNGSDVTENFLKGAREVLKIATLTGARVMYSKERSPSCGVLELHAAKGPGRSAGPRRSAGPGVTTALLQGAGIKVVGR